MKDRSQIPSTPGPSRRRILKSGAGLLAAGAGGLLPASGFAQAGAMPAGPTPADPELRRIQRQRRILLRGGVVLTLDKQLGDFARADVLIEDGKIREIRPDIAVSADSTAVIDARRRIVMPGFINTHHHFYQGVLRNILPNGRLDPDYRQVIGNTLTPAYRAEDVYAGTLITALTMIDMGTTTAVDTSQASHTPQHTDAGLRAHREAGLRVVYAYWTGNGPGVQYPEGAARLQRTMPTSDDALITLALASILDPKAFAFARQAGLKIVTHGVDRAREGQLHELSAAGLLRPGDLYIHCNDLSDATWDTIRDSGGRVSLAPAIEMAMGHGVPGIQGALDHGIRPSLSSDVDTTMAPDMFTLMRAAFTLQRLLAFTREHAGEKPVPALLTSRDVLEFGTIEGARSLGLDQRTGSLTPGKAADVIMLRTDSLNVWPLNNAPGAVVNLMNPAQVDTVFIAGRVRKWRGRLVGIDTERVLRQAEASRDAVLQRAGTKLDVIG
jgi:cytosine/adenosine deaminase-related metal-dependent hydrolase